MPREHWKSQCYSYPILQKSFQAIQEWQQTGSALFVSDWPAQEDEGEDLHKNKTKAKQLLHNREKSIHSEAGKKYDTFLDSLPNQVNKTLQKKKKNHYTTLWYLQWKFNIYCH